MPTVSYRNKNPGNIRWEKGGFTTLMNRGGKEGEGGFAAFPTVIKGLACLSDLLATKTYSNLVIDDFFERYAPSKDHNYPKEYADFVAKHSGITVFDKLSEVNDVFKLLKFMEAIALMEKWSNK